MKHGFDHVGPWALCWISVRGAQRKTLHSESISLFSLWGAGRLASRFNLTVTPQGAKTGDDAMHGACCTSLRLQHFPLGLLQLQVRSADCLNDQDGVFVFDDVNVFQEVHRSLCSGSGSMKHYHTWSWSNRSTRKLCNHSSVRYVTPTPSNLMLTSLLWANQLPVWICSLSLSQLP